MLGVLAGQHRIGPRARRHQHGAGRQSGGAAVGPLQADRRGMARLIHLDLRRRQPLGEADAFLEGLLDLLVIEGVARRIDHAPAIGDGDAAPFVHERRQPRRLACGRGPRPLGADGPGMGDEFLGDRALGRRPGRADRGLAALGRQGFEAAEEFLHLARVIGQRLGRRIDGGEPAADHHRRQAELQIGDGFGLGRARQLQGHEEIRGHAHARRQLMGHVEDGGLARAQAERHMVEAEGEGLLQGQRAAEAHAAEHGEARAPLDQQPDDLQEILVPANGDAVFGHPAEARHGAVVEILMQLADIADRLEDRRHAFGRAAGEFRRQRLDLEPVDGDHRMAVVQHVMRRA